ncbi:RagB/SusD family nutrient uptake outer membrane protein [Mucilaginibacter limnophilus]|uniref:RagB/SusD family nutrient uptake outer membrane protein n=2 Tax=Mucilaginibacter limnophilus TaxID=1932778 RepID=A0A3S2UP69_9SPHI|nr:RagB/SusD family nutrient uptake outer membrane protein [Mucilaginibacter limnophilus]
MKNTFLYLFSLIAFLSVFSTSCKKSLEAEPLEQLSPDYVWDTQDSAGVNASRVLNDIYSEIPNGGNRVFSFTSTEPGSDFLDAATDDAVSSYPSATSVEQIATGTGITPFRNLESSTDIWAGSYRAIRKANIFMANIDKVPLAGTISGNRPLRSAWKAEARFLRALFYFELVKRWGGVPIVGDEVRQITDDVLLPRNSFSDCVEYIVKECDAAKDSLRYDPIDNSNFGRVTRGTAMALKARVLLYAASQLYNGGNIGQNAEQRLVAGYESEQASRWKRAADAAADIVALNVFNLQSDLVNTFIVANNNEVIFARNNGYSTAYETANGPIGFTGNATGNSRTSPTQEFVDCFTMKNGKPITDPTSGYNPNNPYVNRDPRLDSTILHEGSRWLSTTIETFEGGRNKPGGSKVQTKTSYYLRKFMGHFKNQTVYSAHPRNFVMFRLAEVYLNYAEAENEFSGPTPNVYNALYAIRKRAGISPGSGDYGIPAGLSKDAMREIIRNERRVELAFEEHRYWDIRRWKIAADLAKNPLHGLRITRSEVVGSINGTKVEVLKPFFETKMYLYPISQAERDKNKNLIQNPGW